MEGAGAGGAARERRKQLTAAEAVNHKRQLAQMVERERLALTGADSVTDFDDALQMVLVETAFGRYPKHLLDERSGERGEVRADGALALPLDVLGTNLLAAEVGGRDGGFELRHDRFRDAVMREARRAAPTLDQILEHRGRGALREVGDEA
eukprot:g158.t1